MNEATIALTIMTLLILVIFVAFLIWGVRSGQFKNVEEAKYIPFKGDGSQSSAEGGAMAPDDPDDPGKHKGEG
jgi:cbb3-type cytochrome oxidase maturation protein